MLKNTFDPKLPYRAVLYLRMSSKQQNERSPEQQEREIRRVIKMARRKWHIVAVYVDRAKSGRFKRTRPEYLRMMRDIKTGRISVDLILVDTAERLGRVEDLQDIRKKLYERDGVLVLTADSHFADPTTPQGKALGMVEAIRSTEDSRIKAHNVLRSKRDEAELKHWPGGLPPFGYKLQSVMKVVKDREVVDYSLVVLNPETAWIMERLFQKAAETGWGTTKLAKYLNGLEEIPKPLKPFKSSTIGRQLDHEIYYGELVWEKYSTGIVADTRVSERNAPKDMLRVPNFCEPIVSRELWEQVQEVRKVRRDRLREARERKAANKGKLILPAAPGMTLRYLLSGLVFCEACGLRMVASSGGEYRTRDGVTKNYASYVCPGYIAGICGNGLRVPEPWLREVVVATIRDRLFPRAS